MTPTIPPSIDCFTDALARTPMQVLPSNSASLSTKSDGKNENELGDKKKNKKAAKKKCTKSNPNKDPTLDMVGDYFSNCSSIYN